MHDGDTRGETREPSGVLVVRAWLADGEVVARLRWSLPGEAEQRSTAVAGAASLEAWFAGWLRDVMRL